MSRPLEYICQIDSSVIPTIDTGWSVTDPNLIHWGVTVSTTGVLTVTSGVFDLNTPYVMGMDGTQSLWDVSIAGVLLVITSSTPLTSADLIAALDDSNSITWLFAMGLDGQLRVTTETPLENKYYYPAIVVSFAASASSDQFELHAIKPNTTRHRR